MCIWKASNLGEGDGYITRIWQMELELYTISIVDGVYYSQHYKVAHGKSHYALPTPFNIISVILERLKNCDNTKVLYWHSLELPSSTQPQLSRFNAQKSSAPNWTLASDNCGWWRVFYKTPLIKKSITFVAGYSYYVHCAHFEAQKADL